MSKELDDLLALVTSPEDKAAFSALVDRNKATLGTRLESSVAVYDAFVGGDQSAVERAAADAAARTAAAAATTLPASQSRGLDLDLEKLGQLVDQRANTRVKSFVESPEFVESQKALAKSVAEEMGKQFAKDILANAARTSDSIYQVRASHSKEFGAELDTDKFSAFLTANEGKFADLPKAHDAFVADQRIQAQIAAGVKTELDKRAAEAPPIEVPGTSLPSAQSPLGQMMRANKLTTTETARGPAIDNAVKHFRQLQSSHAAN